MIIIIVIALFEYLSCARNCLKYNIFINIFNLQKTFWSITLHLSIVLHVFSQRLSLKAVTIVKDFTWTFSINIYSWGDNRRNPWKEFFFFLILAWNLVTPDSSPLPRSHNKRNWAETKFPASPVLMDISFSFGTKVGYLFFKKKKSLGSLPSLKAPPPLSFSVLTLPFPSGSKAFPVWWFVWQCWETQSAGQPLHEVADCSLSSSLMNGALEGQ